MAPLPDTNDQRAGFRARHPRLIRWLKRIGLVALGIALTLAVEAGVIYWQASSLIDQFHAGKKAQVVKAAMPLLGKPAPKPAPGISHQLTILIIGDDTRGDGGRSDTLILLRINPHTNTVSMLSVPRDLRVPIPGYGIGKINAAFSYGGPRLAIETVRDYFGVPIDHFLQVDFRGFRQLVNELGGVYLPIDGRYYHVNDGSSAENYMSIDLQPGYQLLHGANALAWVRWRHTDDDFLRTARQQIFLREVARALRLRFSDPTKILSLVNLIAQSTTSDISSLSETVRIARTLLRVGSDRINRVTVQGASEPIDGVDYVISTAQQIHDALWSWAHPGQRIRRQTQAVQTLQSQQAPRSVQLTADGGEGRRLISPVVPSGITACYPQGLPSGFAWPEEDAARGYRLAGHPALSAWASSGSGHSVLWMWTTWNQPPILSSPTAAISVAGLTYYTYEESGTTRMIAWKTAGTWTWITNTLTDDLSSAQMLALARSCGP